jgi:hypothetical protein
MTRPTIAKIEGPKSSIRRRIREGESGGPLSDDKEGGAGGRVSADGDDPSPLSAEADSFRMSHGGGGRSSAIRAPSKSAKSISDQGLPLLMSGMFDGGRLRRRNHNARKYRSVSAGFRVPPSLVAVQGRAKGRLGVLEAGAIAPRQDTAQWAPVIVSDQNHSQPGLGVSRFLPDAADRPARHSREGGRRPVARC